MEQTTTYANCPSCNSKLGSGLLTSNDLVSKKYVPIIQEFTDNKVDAFCSKCYEKPFTEAKGKWLAEMKMIQEKIEFLIKNIMIVSIHSPVNWQYDVLGLVTGQSTTGTGAYSAKSEHPIPVKLNTPQVWSFQSLY